MILFRRSSICFLILFGAFLPAFSGAAAADNAEVAALSSGMADEDLDRLPTVLSEADADRYQRIFDIQEDGDWKAADKLIAALEDRLLIGHVMAQRYLHPTRYRSGYKELKEWMDSYADLPYAPEIYKLALTRRHKNQQEPARPAVFYDSGIANAQKISGGKAKASAGQMSRRRSPEVSARNRDIRSRLRNGMSKSVSRFLLSTEAKTQLGAVEYDQAAAQLAARYFTDGHDDLALEWATKAAKRSGARVPDADWTAGLISWRLKRYGDAARHFEAVAKAPGISPWMISAGYFWAARSSLVGGAPEKYNPLLMSAAGHPRTFYGLLAHRLLGMPMPFRWTSPDLDQATIDKLYKAPPGRRALALLQTGMTYRAELELRNLSAVAGEDVAKGILSVAVRAGMSSLAGRLDMRLFPDGGGYDGAAYPLPDWEGEESYSVDRALVYALIRQESQFNPKAKSRAGARGLMQLMPKTASFVARDRLLHGSGKQALFEPEVNLRLGQKYIHMLLNDDKIKGDMFLMTAAWNGGLGNLSKWRRKVDDLDDSLFFIETLPSHETRNFIERVFTNLWIYHDRLGQAAPSLDAIAAGDWPLYIAQDKESLQVAENGENRRRAGISAR
ncbi:MAG: hypothetical protein A3G18_11935 [Rhodospirillales bacterium RIFCSPLOWO2_12_FULL_58_28]|nr:MAG: hypothetical protein A3H92_12125 [Rhodospirillales bacterium RIFCSPLOWO2_02_FULL_58_16]OHC77520.1 MAG: hypothetical protein A3G18_11935 [Rhodospirillales bacterium RIFCSPLOWO2_12_FULL_58_28]